MAIDSNVFVKLTTEYDGKALAKGKKDLTDFEKLTKRVGKSLGAAFAFKKIVAFGEQSVKAFIESEKAGKALNQTLTNLGMAYKSPAIDMYLQKLSLQYGILDEELKPAYNQLLVATRDTAQAQSILSTALDVSAGTGKDLASVTAALSKAYVGNNTAIQKLGIGLSKAQLTTLKFADIQKELNSIFAGQAAYAAQGYTGDIQKLTVAWDQFQESIGKGILTGIESAGSIDKTTESITKLGNALGVATGYLVKFATGWVQLFDKTNWQQFWDELTGKKAVIQVDAGSDRGGKAKADDQRRSKLAALQAKTATLQTTAAKAQSAAAKAQLLLTKAGSVLDVQQAQIYAALQGKITEQEKLRLDLQLALLTKNEDAAYALSQQLLVSQLKTTDLASTIANFPKALNPFADWPKYIQDLINQMAGLKAAIPVPATSASNAANYLYQYNSLSQQQVPGDVFSAPQGYGGGLANPKYDTSVPQYGYNSMPQSQFGNVTINVDATNMVDPNNMTTVVQNALLLINRNGLIQVPAGQGF